MIFRGGVGGRGNVPPWALAIGAAFILMVIFYNLLQRRSAAGVTADGARITQFKDDGNSLATIEKSSKQSIWCRATLQNVPWGLKVPLTWDWLDPAGKVVLNLKLRTNFKLSSTIPINSKLRMKEDYPSGKWTVKLSIEGRELFATQFELK